jgi:hypothetical protein
MAISFKIQDDFESGIGQLLSVFSDVSAWAVFDRPRLITAKNGVVKLAFDDSTRAIISFEIVDGGVRVNIHHELLKNETEIKPRKLYWKEVLAGMHRRLDQK